MKPENDITITGYQIFEKLGSGGMGDVYRARQESLDRIIALKVLPPELLRNREFAGRFYSEARVISMLEHQNIVTIYDFGEENKYRFFAMQYVEGNSLDQIIQKDKQLKIEQAIDYSRQILRALKYAHEHNVMHRDIKPHNVLIDRNGKVFVTDFGIAKMFSSTGITNTGMTIGTPEYMSPEQAEGAKLDVQTDIYSMGIVMYEMLVGRPPFVAESPIAVAYKQVNEQPRPPYELTPATPKRLGLLVLKALKKDKKQRYQTAAQMLADLDSVIGEDLKLKTTGVYTQTKYKEEAKAERRLTDRRMGSRRHAERRDRKKWNYARVLTIPLILLAAVAGFIFYYVFSPPATVSHIRDFKLSATSTAASIAGHKSDIRFLTDGKPTTVWAEGSKGAGKQEYVIFTFKRPVILSRIGIWNGYQGNSGEWLQFNRLKEAELYLSDNKKINLKLDDRKGCQYFNMPMQKTTFLRIAIIDVYPGVEKDITPVSDIELLGIHTK